MAEHLPIKDYLWAKHKLGEELNPSLKYMLIPDEHRTEQMRQVIKKYGQRDLECVREYARRSKQSICSAVPHPIDDSLQDFLERTFSDYPDLTKLPVEYAQALAILHSALVKRKASNC